MQLDRLEPHFLRYLVAGGIAPGESLPTLAEIGQEMDVSVGKLREQLEFARRLGLVSARPRVGMRREPFDFTAAILPSLLFSMATGESTFAQFSELRRTLETAMWHPSVAQLTEADLGHLRGLIAAAWEKLRGDPAHIHIPNGEHRQLHLTIFKHLDNPFVQGIFSAYWEAYEASELTRLADYRYWLTVWDYHERLVDALCEGDFDLGLQILIDHFALLPTVSVPAPLPGG